MEGLKPKEIESNIYRIIDIERFEKMVMDNYIGFVIPSKWEDPYEDILYNKLKEYDLDFQNHHQSNNLFGQCWTFNKDTDAMWRIYSNSKRGVKVQANLFELHNYIKEVGIDNFDVLITKVIYKSTEEIEDFLVDSKSYIDFTNGLLGNWEHFNEFRMKTLSFKRLEFKHEREVRILLQLKNPIVNDVFQFKFDINKIIKNIVLDPRLTSSEYDFLKRKLKKLGFEGEISKSELYQVSSKLDDNLRGFEQHDWKL